MHFVEHWNKNINFNENEAESKMENPTCSFGKANLALQFIQELQVKSETVMIWSPRKKKEGIFCTAYFVRRKIFLTFVFYLNLSFRIYIHLTYQKTLCHTLFCLFLSASLICKFNMFWINFDQNVSSIQFQYYELQVLDNAFEIFPLISSRVP